MAADNVTANPGAAGAVFRTFSDGTNEWPAGICAFVTGGSAGGWTLQEVDATHGLPCSVIGTVPVSGTFWQATQPISAASLPLPTGAATSAKQPALGTAGTASADVLTVQGIASMTALKVDGSAVTQPVSAASLPLPAGAATTAKQPALGTAGTASADVLSVQGIASMTALKVDGSAVTQPVSGTVTANVGTTNGLALDATLTGGTQKAIPAAATTGGATPYHLISAATTNATSVKASAGQVYSVTAFNTNASPRYLKFYDLATSPTVGTTAVVQTYLIPGNTSGSGLTLALPVGMNFASGIALAITGGIADADTTAIGSGDVAVSLTYK